MTNRQAMQLTLGILISSLGLSALPVQAQVFHPPIAATMPLFSAANSSLFHGQFPPDSLNSLNSRFYTHQQDYTLSLWERSPISANYLAKGSCQPLILPLPMPKPSIQTEPNHSIEIKPIDSSNTPLNSSILIKPVPQPNSGILIKPLAQPITQPNAGILIKPLAQPIAQPNAGIQIKPFSPSTITQGVQVSEAQISALVEALRLAAPKTGNQKAQVYTAWKILPVNISRWSKQCIGRELTPAEFTNKPTIVKTILNCVMGNVLREQYRASSNNESMAVQRSAVWWMTGDANRYITKDIVPYTQKVLGFYQQLRSNSVAQIPLFPHK